MKPVYIVFCIFGLLLSTINLYATHNRAGEITWVQDSIDPLVIHCTVTTYTKASSTDADRDSLTVCWDKFGNCETVLRVNGPDNKGEIVAGAIDMKKNIYTASHKYPGFGHYCISMTDQNRNGGVKNIPFSINTPFSIFTTCSLFNPQVLGANSSPQLAQPPIDNGCLNRVYKHNPGAHDPDNDSLSFHLVTPWEGIRDTIDGYVLPSQIAAGPNNNISIDPVKGDIVWDSPKMVGEYNIAIMIIQYRDGKPLDTLIRDMQILIEECDNNPPEVATIDEICVVAGTLLTFDVTGSDQNDDKVLLTAAGGPLEQKYSPAQFIAPATHQDQPVTGEFQWQTSCEHISDQPYFVVFRAVDNAPNPLAGLKTVVIKVVGPSPEDIQAEPSSTEIVLTWEMPYACEDAKEDYFSGFSIYRREGSNPFTLDTCNPGISGYMRLERDYTQSNAGRYEYIDMDVERGRTYCYRVLGGFAKLSSKGFPFNRVESLASDEICVQLNRDVPLITHVDVVRTDAMDGVVDIRWTRPVAEDLDTVLNHGPYTYQVLRADGFTTTGLQPVPGGVFTAPTFSTAIDTFFRDSTGLNTQDQPYTYHIAFFVRGEGDPLGTTNEASSVFLTVASTDNTNNLSWEEHVPWINDEYTIYRRDPGSTIFDSIGISDVQAFSDTGLVNGLEYCYFIRSKGSYSIDNAPSPIFNRSQQTCGIPLDTVPPCPPVLSITNACDDATVDDPEDIFKNILSWINPMDICPETDDVVSYKVYYAPEEGAPFELIAWLQNSDDTFYIDRPALGIAGCYAVTALDTFENESRFSNIICVDNCPTYELPNVFTPNGDSHNDLFIPFPYRFVDHIELEVFNRWGEMVFKTEDPDINWTGKNMDGKDLTEGTYFYSCKVYERRVAGVTLRPEILSGFIELVRGE